MTTSSTATGTYRSSFSFKDAVLLSANSTNSSWFFSDVVDLNSDDRKDLVFFGATYPIGAATSEPRGSLFYWGSGHGTYSLATDRDITLPKTVHPREVVYADFNEDHVLDIFVADHGWDTLNRPEI